MIYAVDRFIDQIREKEKPEYDAILKQDRYHYFNTERDARDFIRNRAREAVRRAEAELAKAVHRHRKCYVKFPPIKLNEPAASSPQDGGAQK